MKSRPYLVLVLALLAGCSRGRGPSDYETFRIQTAIKKHLAEEQAQDPAARFRPGQAFVRRELQDLDFVKTEKKGEEVEVLTQERWLTSPNPSEPANQTETEKRFYRLQPREGAWVVVVVGPEPTEEQKRIQVRAGDVAQIPVNVAALEPVPGETIANAVRLYNHLLMATFKSGKIEDLAEAALPDEVHKVDVIIFSLRTANQWMDSRLQSLVFEPGQVRPDGEAEVRTREHWAYRHLDGATGQAIKAVPDIEYQLIYRLVRVEGRWKVRSVRHANESQLVPEGYWAVPSQEELQERLEQRRRASAAEPDPERKP